MSNTNTTHPSSFALIRRLWRNHISVHWGKIVAAIICMIITAATTAAFAWLMEPLIDEMLIADNASLQLWIPSAIVAISMLKAAGAFGQQFIMKYVGQRIITDMQLMLYRYLLDADLAMLGRHSSGHLISRFSNDITIMKNAVSNVLTAIAKELLTLLFLIGLMFYQNPMLAVVAFVIFPSTVYPIIHLGRKMRKVARKTQEELGQFTTRLDETFTAIRMVKAYVRESYEISRSRIVIERLFKLYIKAARTESFSSPIMEVLSGVAIAAVVWYGGYQVHHGVTTEGALISFITAVLMAYKPLKSLSSLNTSLQEGLAAAQRFFTLLDVEPTITNHPKAIPLSIAQETAPEVTFQDVSFSYGEEHARALHRISFTVPAGKTIALVGASGSGKSTIMNLLLRFYDPEAGVITINGQNIAEVTLDSLREHIAIVSQEVMLFDDTIRANILYGDLDASDEAIIDAAYNAAAHDFISALEQGYDTVVGQHGLRLSGGQRQRISIARAMLKNAPLLLLDEATSALDTTSEQQVHRALQTLMEGRTTLVIAHRLSTIMNADEIYVLDNGNIIESGTHEALLANNAHYATLYHKQFGQENIASS